MGIKRSRENLGPRSRSPALRPRSRSAPQQNHSGSSAGLPILPAAPNRFAFKILCSDSLVETLQGSGPGCQEWLERETGAELVLGSDADCYPDTPFRVLGVYADDPNVVTTVLETLIGKVIELGEVEREKGPPYANSGLCGKVKGEYVFRLCMRDTAAKVLIGPRGAFITALRRDTAAKVFVENETVHGQQMTRIIGRSEAMLKALHKIRETVHNEVGEQGYLSWMQFLGSPGKSAAAPGSAEVPSGTFNTKPASETPDRPLLRPKIRPGSALLALKAARPVPKASAKLDAPGADGPVREFVRKEPVHVDTAAIDASVDRLADIVGQLPPGASKLQYQISCDLPAEWEEGEVATSLKDYASHIREMTKTQVLLGAEVDPDNPELARVVNIVGPLLDVYHAHLMLMSRIEEETERRVAEEEEEERRRAREEEAEQEEREQAEEQERKKRRVDEMQKRAREAQEERKQREESERQQRELEERRELEAFDAEVERQKRELELEEEERRRHLEEEERRRQRAEAAAAAAAAEIQAPRAVVLPTTAASAAPPVWDEWGAGNPNPSAAPGWDEWANEASNGGFSGDAEEQAQEEEEEDAEEDEGPSPEEIQAQIALLQKQLVQKSKRGKAAASTAAAALPGLANSSPDGVLPGATLLPCKGGGRGALSAGGKAKGTGRVVPVRAPIGFI